MEGPHTQHERFSTSRGTRSQTLHKVHGHPVLQISLPALHTHTVMGAPGVCQRSQAVCVQTRRCLSGSLY